jgi:flagellum-specific ATP synthase
VRKLMAAYKEKEDLIAIGAYQPGTDPPFLRQSVEESSSAGDADGMLAALATLSGSVEIVTAEHAMPETPLHTAIPPLNIAS